MSNQFNIKSNGVITSAEPIDGKWYCGFTMAVDARTGEVWERDGALAKYIGDGQFEDEDGYTEDLSDYEYLVEQA